MTHQVQGVMTNLFILETSVVDPDKSFYYYSICTSQIVALIVIMVAVYYRCPISTTQACVFSLLGASISHNIFPNDTSININWNSFIVLLGIWCAAPLITMMITYLIYVIINKAILSSNTKIRSLVTTPYISGIVFLIYFSFVFTTELFMMIPNSMIKTIVAAVILLIGFYIGLVFKRMHFFITKVTPSMKFFKTLKNSLLVWYY